MDATPPKPADESPGTPRRPAWTGPVAAVGALAALVTAAFRLRKPAGAAAPSAAGGAAQSRALPNAATAAPATSAPVPIAVELQRRPQPARTFPRQYSLVATIGGERSADAFARSLDGVAVGGDDGIYALGDAEVRVFDATGRRVRAWKTVDGARCLTVAADGRVLIGAGNRVQVYDAGGRPVSTMTVGTAERPAEITALKVHGDAIFVADVASRVVRRLDASGREVGLIGNRDKTNGFMLPNRLLDVSVDARGVVYATDPGRHQVTLWTLDGEPAGKFGRFGMVNAEDFVGCCNPINLAVLADGTVVVSEKVAARVKVFAPDRTLLAVIGPGVFDPMCTFIPLAVDSRGRIVAADPLRREIKVFAI